MLENCKKYMYDSPFFQAWVKEMKGNIYKFYKNTTHNPTLKKESRNFTYTISK